MTRCMPLAAAIRDTSSPNPEAAPVMTAVRPENVFIRSILCSLELIANPGEVDVNGARPIIAALDDDLVGRQPDQGAAHRVDRVVGRGHGDRGTGLEAQVR